MWVANRRRAECGRDGRIVVNVVCQASKSESHRHACRPSVSPWRFRSLVFAAAIALQFGLLTGSRCFAGGGPENIFLVVNGRSWASQTIANHYIDLRFIPSSNVFYLNWDGSVYRTDIATFREKILTPILETIDKRGLANQIDCVVYSADFPYEIDFSAEIQQAGRFMSGSLTGLTYLYQTVLARDTPRIGEQISNWYANTGPAKDSTRAFTNRQLWSGPTRASVDDKGRRYLMSVMLGYTSGRGNSVEDILHYLERSALADGMHPVGTFYFMQNNDIRAKTRMPYFDAVVGAIRREGGKAEILEEVMPSNKDDVMGAMLGRAVVRWNSSRIRLLPGAICENLTSFGGVLKDGASQTPLTDFLKYGAAGSSGTVIEPYSLQAKFPHPIIHLHYFRGCSLAEAFYLSVTSPYQLLIVGDPLCKPFATIPHVQVLGIQPHDVVAGEVIVQPSVQNGADEAVDHYLIFIDSRLRHTDTARCAIRL